MKLINGNIFAEIIQGCLDRRFVFRKCKGQVVIAKWPAKRAGLSELQQKQVSRFKEAAAYAKGVIADEEIRRLYDERAMESERFVSAYNLAISDYMCSPVIEYVDLSGYCGGLGDEIIIVATDNFKVANVMVEIYRDDGSLVEVGMADGMVGDPEAWVYYAQSEIASVAGYSVNVRVTDLPGNAVEKVVSL